VIVSNKFEAQAWKLSSVKLFTPPLSAAYSAATLLPLALFLHLTGDISFFFQFFEILAPMFLSSVLLRTLHLMRQR
jgi:hypothetical protein